jgi:hypothetical protein
MNGRPWTPSDDALLRERYPDECTADLARELDRSLGSLFQHVAKLGLTKSEAFRESDRSGRIQRGRTDPRLVATQIQKGSKPWNTGTKGISGTHPNCRRTQFQPGHKGGKAVLIEQPLGAERITKDGILQRKINNDLPFQRRWRSVHSLVWEVVHGPIPDGYKVIFRPGQHTSIAEQITVDKLELVTHAELMRRNSYHTRYPKDLGLLIQMKGQLTRKINKKTEEFDDQKQA